MGLSSGPRNAGILHINISKCLSTHPTQPNPTPKKPKNYFLFPSPLSLSAFPPIAKQSKQVTMAAPPPNPINKPRNPKKHSLKDLKTLGHQLLSSRTHINNLPLLLTYISPSFPPQHVLESLLSLHSFFSPILPDLPSSSRSPTHNKDNDEPDADVIYKTWLRSKFDEFVKSLVDVAVSPKAEDALKVSTFNYLFLLL